jgi:hypothetical protein
MHQYFDEETRACVSLAGGPCDSTPNGLTKCTENAQCHEESPHNYCRCIMGYIEDNDGKCVKAYGTACELDEECDPIPDLACIDNICSCPDKLQVREFAENIYSRNFNMRNTLWVSAVQ